jgi:hypothetical protein
MLIPIAPERFEEVQRALREEAAQSVGQVKNLDALRALSVSGVFHFRGQKYTAAPIGYDDGAELQRIMLEAYAKRNAETTAETVEEARGVCSRLAVIYRRASRPSSRWRRMLRWVLPNPFRSMTETEAGTLLRFFSACRTRSSVWYEVTSTESEGTQT